MGQTLGTGDYRYEEVEDWTPVDFEGVASDMATDSQDLVYLAVRLQETRTGPWGAEDDLAARPKGEIGPPSRAKLPGLGKGVPAPRPAGWDSVRGLEPGGRPPTGALYLCRRSP